MLRQVGELLLGSIPTILFMLALWGSYSVLVHQPLTRVLADRRAKTEGAVERARADVAAAEARTAEYEQKLREARVALFKRQEERRQRALERRAAALEQARQGAHTEIEKGRAAIEQDKVAAQERLQGETAKLAAEIVRVVLQPGATSSPAGGAR
ncbi:MAG: ATP synthase F0 subunit B [Acidobacteriaceae bacterium]|nr:ATP synthase F0 subunit B [Acidobacteriaceae bacterium]